jgi:hypothetical protein
MKEDRFRQYINYDVDEKLFYIQRWIEIALLQVFFLEYCILEFSF